MRNAKRTVVERRAEKKSAERHATPRQICRKRPLSRKQLHDDFCCSEIRSHTAGHAEHGKNDRRDELAVFFFAKLPYPPYRALFFHQ